MSTPTPAPAAPKRGPGRPPKSDGAPRAKKQQRRESIPIIARAVSPEARTRAAAILEVLGGMRSTTSAAEALGCSLPRYYHLEARALHGFLEACEPNRRSAYAPSPAREVETLSRKCERLERELSRQLAIVRAAHRTIGLTPPPQAKSKRKRGQRKRPVVRALVAADLLRADPASNPQAAPPITS